MERNVRYKLHKVKKQWVTIGVTALSMVTMSAALIHNQEVQADEVSPLADTSSDNETSADLLEVSYANKDVVAEASVDTTSQESNRDLANQEVQEVATATTDTQNQLQTETSSAQTAKEVVVSTATLVSENQDNAVSQNETKEQLPSQTTAVASQEDLGTQQAHAGQTGFRRASLARTSNRNSTRRGTITNTRLVNPNETITIKPNSNTSISISATGITPNLTIITDGNTPKPVVTINNKPVTNQPSNQPSQPGQAVKPLNPEIGQGTQYASNLKTINGKQYYVENGQIKKNHAVEIGGKLYYFGQDGALVNQEKPAHEMGLTTNTSIYARHNQAYNTQATTFETLDNFLTADSWYRPKKILKNGRNWVNSSDKDFRPLLMTWWPDKTTQVDYLNYMTQQGLGSQTYTKDASQASLNSAAQDVQKRIEERIGREGNTNWLRTTMANFVKTQPGWNASSEDTLTANKDHFQGGALVFNNSRGKGDTSHADSKYRLMNRTPTNQTGVRKYFVDGSVGGYELLLANDIDNSNPAVQAEQLNWLHYIMNIGSILGNDPSANFDGVRIDAVDNVDADLLQIASDYFKEKYRVADNEDQAIKHLSILEAWSHNDHFYNKDTKGAQLSIDNPLRETLLTTFLRDRSIRGSLERVITNSLNNRASDKKQTPRDANYVFVRAHDSEVQGVLARIITENINPNTDGFTFTMDELKQAFKIYNEDMRKADKKYTQYNIPTAHALMLTNKDSITRVYYGDMYTDDGQYMAQKSPYYDAIDTLMRGRIKYVAGGQDMKVHKHNGFEILSSVRYGKGADEATDLGTAETRTQGILVLAANNPDLKLAEDDKVVVNMGAAHKNQAYRPLLLSKTNGLSTYLEDRDVPAGWIRYTDAQGNLTFTAADIAGHSTVEVNGYLAVWVPVGAKADQDARTQPSKSKTGDQVYNSSAALDSQLIYEGFSNFQDFAQTPAQYTNKLIAQNAQLFKEWGVTSFEFAPQYVSSQDGTFLDSIIENGYAFEDRYDIALSKNNKYGSLQDLMDALRAVHAQGISAIADWVPDQIYNLPGKEVVNATRTNSYGTPRPGAEIFESLYAAKTKTFGDDYQGKYGGAFLDELKAKYPAIFQRVQISTGEKINPNEKITQWSAKYFNGSNIQGTGARYVLQDQSSSDYFTVTNDKVFLPKQMTGTAQTGFVRRGNQIQFFSSSGYQAKDAFIEHEGLWYYFDQNGNMVKGAVEMNGKRYFFLDNGVQLRHVLRQGADGQVYYYDPKGVQAFNGFHDFAGPRQDVRYFNEKGQMLKGLHQMYGTTFYFDEQTGIQAKDKVVRFADGKVRYFIADTGNLAYNRFAQDKTSKDWYYFGADGLAVTGLQTIAGKGYYFASDGRQIKGQFITVGDSRYYIDGDSGEIVKSRFIQVSDKWYYANTTGQLVRGAQTIDDKLYFFNEDYSQLKGGRGTDSNGVVRYYDANSGQAMINGFMEVAPNQWVYMNHDGNRAVGLQTIAGKVYYFDENGIQAKGRLVTQGNRLYYFDPDSGERVTDGFRQVDGKWYYFRAKSGEAYKGRWRINGKEYYFNSDGSQVKGQLISQNGRKRYYDTDSGELVTNRFVQVQPNSWYYFDAQGYALTGAQTINGQQLYFDNQGRQVKGRYVTVNGIRRYYDTNSGELVIGR